MGGAASEALGTGAWGAAAEVVASMPDTPPPPAVEVIKARALTSSGRPDLAVAALESIAQFPLDVDERSLLSLARASAHQMAGDSDALWREVETLSELGHRDPVVGSIAETWLLIRTACQGGSIADARRSLDDLVSKSYRSNLGHFAGIALHNSATAALAQGDFSSAVRLARNARAVLGDLPPDASIAPSTLATEAVAVAELGDIQRARALADEVARASDAHPDAIADIAYLASVSGDIATGKSLRERLRRLMSSGPAQVGSQHQAGVARVAGLLAAGSYRRASIEVEDLATGSTDELDGVSRTAYLQALTSTLLRQKAAPRHIEAALAACRTQQSWRWETRVLAVEATQQGDASEFGRLVSSTAQMSELAVLELADLVGSNLHLLDPIPERVRHCIGRHLSRWRPILLRQIDGGLQPAAPAAARLLASYGMREDASLVAAFERAHSGSGGRQRLSRELVRRVSPTLRVHDLGRTTYEVAGEEVVAAAARRKAISLLLFLVTRPKQTATREQAMEALWPDQSPSSAINSLHQTLHFVRRDIAPWQDDGSTADYVPLQSELLYLDPELVQVDSVAFLRQADDALKSTDTGRVGKSILRSVRWALCTRVRIRRLGRRLA